MLTPLDQILSIDMLTFNVKLFAEQREEHSASKLFATSGRPLQPRGHTASWDEVGFHRHLAPVTGRDSPHPRVKRLPARKRECVMATIKAYKDLPGSALWLQRAPGFDVADAEHVLSVELEDLAQIIANTREYLATGALLGRIEVSEQTVPGSEIEFTIEFGNRSARALSPWADPNTKIRSGELLRLKRLFKDEAGVKAGYALTEPGIEGQLVNNAEVKAFVKGKQAEAVLKNLTLTGTNPQWDGLAGLAWRFTDGTYKPEGGQVTRYFPQDTVVVLPEAPRLKDVLGYAEGVTHVPDGARFTLVPDAAPRAFRPVRGFYSYAVPMDDPFGIRLYAGWRGLPVILDPNAVLVYRTGAPAGVP